MISLIYLETVAMSSIRKKSPTRSAAHNGPTVRRLSDADVRAIFECLHDAHPVPSHLNFSIVRVGPNGLKLSPPSFEFEGTAAAPRIYMCLFVYAFII